MKYNNPFKTYTAALSKPILSGIRSSARRKQYRSEEGSFEQLLSDNNFSSADYNYNHRLDISSNRRGYFLEDTESESY